MNKQNPHFRYHILNEIRRLATAMGKAPGQPLFARETQIAEQRWKGIFWPSWGDALTEAGYGLKPSKHRAGGDSIISPETSPPPVKHTEDFVYLIKSGDQYKIGRSEQIEDKVRKAAAPLAEKLTIIHAIRTDDPPGIEAYWHNRFKEKRANGEWFKLSEIEVSAFKKRKFQ